MYIKTIKIQSTPCESVNDQGNIIIIIRKHMRSKNGGCLNLSIYVATIQKRQRYVRLRKFRKDFVKHETNFDLDTPNSLHTLNRSEDKDFQRWVLYIHFLRAK